MEFVFVTSRNLGSIHKWRVACDTKVRPKKAVQKKKKKSARLVLFFFECARAGGLLTSSCLVFFGGFGFFARHVEVGWRPNGKGVYGQECILTPALRSRVK